MVCLFFFLWGGDHRDLHVLTHSFPTRRSADLRVRMELSRSRQRNERKGKKNLRFSLHQSIYPWTTLDGKRLERVLVTSTRTQTHQNLELLDDLIEKKGIELT